MTLFDECREALFSDFHLVIGDEENKAIDLLNKYPIALGGLYGMRYNIVIMIICMMY